MPSARGIGALIKHSIILSRYLVPSKLFLRSTDPRNIELAAGMSEGGRYIDGNYISGLWSDQFYSADVAGNNPSINFTRATNSMSDPLYRLHLFPMSRSK